MCESRRQTLVKALRLGLAALGGLLLLSVLLLFVSRGPATVHADPIEPPEGYPKLNLSVKTVTPTLAATGGVTLTYEIQIRNTGAYTATGVTLSDDIPEDTTFTGDLGSSAPPTPTITTGTLTWTGEVGFDATVVLSFSVAVAQGFSGTIQNAAVISHPLAAQPVTATAETVVTDHPILTIKKVSSPAKPGPNKPLIYTLQVANQGQPLVNKPITVTDRVPLSTTVLDVGDYGYSGTVGSGVMVTWTRQMTLDLGDSTEFTFSVEVGDVLSGTVIANDDYQVASPDAGVAVGEPHTVTVINPILSLSKHVWPDPPGSNREMTYILELFNVGSLATDLVITDRVPAGEGTYFRYVRGGAESSGIVSWNLEHLDTYQSAEFTYTVYISDVMGIPIVNDDYRVCSAEDVCQPGEVLTSVVQGPHFEMVRTTIDPIARKPGGGNLTTTLVMRNLGPGNALDARAELVFRYISLKAADLYVDPPVGTPVPLPEIKDDPACTDHCKAFEWIGPVGVGQMITFATTADPSTQVGEEGNVYSATIVITDGFTLNNRITVPVTGTASGRITHKANLIPTKVGPRVIGRGQVLTYTIDVWNSALATDEPPYPYLWDIVPISGTEVITSSISHGGKVQTVTLGAPGSATMFAQVISWTLPAFGTGEQMAEPRQFAVRVNDDLVSGTKIVNSTYIAGAWEFEDGRFFENLGKPVTTTVLEIGLIDSYKEVTPTLASPGPGNVLTYYLHIVNSSPLSLTGVTVYDDLPWEAGTYQRDAVASAGQIISDIVSIQWEGDVAGLSSEVVTFTVLVDEDYQGPVTNTAVISHADLLNEVIVHAVAYVTDEPVLRITKVDSPDPVKENGVLHYRIIVSNLGQQATELVITDTVPANTEIVTDSITAGGEFDAASGQVQWESDFLRPGRSRTFEFDVTVKSSEDVINEWYGVRCAEGVAAQGQPVVTRVIAGTRRIYLPLVMRNA
jgi:uncharacterized repeat protein (TIGR01451 family)